ncbi:ankyrin repeat-containing protein [Corynascus novoguineensis]|uniref:Ankyrin repeat-containing protein n=1 Tax=Corynascus novoguineensis TaxID=1126955 RepID=A0AAN7HNV2_9PEZI|nr:ankyrin repeat-containing protein [Corynascus novoguineensis]
MSKHTASSGDWERWKNAIHALYVLENLPLRGPSGVIETMKSRYGFSATKRQYEHRFQQWGFEKNIVGENYPVIASKLGKRKAAGKESNVFWKGELVPPAKIRKESARHGYMTTLEKMYQAQASAVAISPKTPPGVEITTPPTYPVVRRVFQELPVLNILRSVNIGSACTQLPFDSGSSTLSSVLGTDFEVSKPHDTVAAIRSLIPISAFEHELSGPSNALGHARDGKPTQILKVAAYLISNNFPGDCNRAKMYEWLRDAGVFVSGTPRFLREPSSRSLRQGLLRLAVEGHDTITAGAILDAGADPNESICMAVTDHIPLTPLQYSYLHGDVDLVKRLLQAHAKIDHSESGWPCSPLLVVINAYRHHFEHRFGVRKLEILMRLVHQLLKAGANVNAIAPDFKNTRYYECSTSWLAEMEPWGSMFCLVRQQHSALTLAAAAGCPQLVEFLIAHGADVSYHVVGYDVCGARSALRECLLNSSERRKWLGVDRIIRLGLPALVKIAKTFIKAKVELNDHLPWLDTFSCCNIYRHQRCDCHYHCNFDCYSALDLGILTGNSSLISALWSAGAQPTLHPTVTGCDFWFAGSLVVTEQQKTRAKVLAAIELGDSANLERIAESYDCSKIFNDCHGLKEAIQECCLEGYDDTLLWLVERRILPEQPKSSVLGYLIALAIQQGHLERVDAFLKAGADVNGRLRKDRNSPLWLAIEQKNKTLVQKLLDHGAYVQDPSMGNLLVHAIEMYYPLVVAIFKRQWELVHQLVQRGALANQQCPSRFLTPLAAAVRADNITLVQWLIEMGAELGDHSALSAAAEKVDSVFLRLFLDELSDEKRSGERHALYAAVYTAIDHDRLENFGLLLKRRIVDVNTLWNCKRLLHYALHSRRIRRHCLEFVRLVLEAGACPHTVLYGSMQKPITALIAAICGQDLECVKIILEKTASKDGAWLPGTEYSPLQVATLLGSSEIIKLLLVHGHNPNIVPLPAQGKTDSRVNSQSVPNKTLWEEGYELSEVYSYLEEGINFLTEHWPKTPLQIACLSGHLEVVECLIEYGADVNAPPDEEAGATALQFAAMGGYLGIAYLLLQKGADVNAAPAQSEGRTALEGAAEHGRIDMVRLLMNAGEDISEPGGQYERALDRASVKGHWALSQCQLLINRSCRVVTSNSVRVHTV